MSTEQTLLKCLGQQEETLHKYKISTQAVNFHQQFISDVINFKNLRLKTPYLKEVCGYKSGLKSFQFLKVFLKYKGQIFTKRLPTLESDEIYEKVLSHIENYISLVQNASPSAECLFVGQPAVSKFLFKVLYLRDSLSAKEILNKQKLGLQVLDELEQFPRQSKNCSK